MQNEDNRNFILAMFLSLAILLGWFFFFGPSETPTGETQTAQSEVTATEADEGAALLARDEAIAQSARVQIDAPRIAGSINLVGGRIDDITLNDYKLTQEENSDNIHLLSPVNSTQAYFIQNRFTAGENVEKSDIPNNETLWTLEEGDVLGFERPVTLLWTSPSGIEYRRNFQVDENFMLDVTDSVKNTSAQDIELRPYSYVSYLGNDSRFDQEAETRPASSGYLLHEGGIRNVDGSVIKSDFGDIKESSPTQIPGIFEISDNVEEFGWVGLTTKYWLTAVIPPNGGAVSKLRYVQNTDTFTAELYLAPAMIAAGEEWSETIQVYAGAKEIDLVRQYRDERELNRFDDSVDWGWLYFLTKPISSVLHWLYGFLGNMGLAIIGLTFIVKLILFPLAYRSFVSMSKMKKLQPKMEKLREELGDDRVKMQQATMELYRQEKVNPVAGCLPILLQIPIFFALYTVLYVDAELRQAPFFGPWTDLSLPDPTSLFNLFGLLPWAAPEVGTFLSLVFLGILPIILGVSMWLTQKLNPTPADPTQAMIFTIMPWAFMFMMGGFATGLLIYWITNNTLTFIQQYSIMRSQGVDPNILGNIRGKKKSA